MAPIIITIKKHKDYISFHKWRMAKRLNLDRRYYTCIQIGFNQALPY